MTSPISFKLFVTGSSPRTELAISNLQRICREVLGSACDVQVIDALDNPELAEQEKVLATPTLIKNGPGPRRRVTGDLSDTAKVIQMLMLSTETGDEGA